MAFKKLTAGLMASSMILGVAQTAAAEITTATPFETAVKMNKLGVVKGVGTLPTGEIDFNLGGNLTRAELVTTIVRSFGFESSAQVAKGAPSFADVAGSEWYSGYVAVAKNLAEQQGTTIGRDSHTFDPNGNVSKAEALVFVMKFLGIKVTSTGANWYEAWIAKAVELGMISEADAAIALANPGSSATRGEAFVILDFGYSAKVLEGGASLYTAFVDSVKPTVEASAAETTAETKITVSGKVSDDKAVAAVFVNGTAVEVKDGNFSAEVELKVGANTIEVSATDVAGNTQAKTLTVTRSNAAATSIEAADVTVAAGAEVSVAVKLLDANGAEIADANVTGTSDLGTFAGGKFTAGTKAGEGKLTLKVGDLTKEVAVKVTAGALAKVTADKTGVAVNDTVVLSGTDAHGNAIEGVTFSTTQDGAFLSGNKFVATKSGKFEVTATKGGESITTSIGVYGALAAFRVTAPEHVVGNTSTATGTTYEVKVEALDKDGNFIPAYQTNVASLTIPGIATTKKTDMEDGVQVYTFTADRALVGEKFKATASYTASGSTYTGSSAEFTVEAQVATAVKVSAPDYLKTHVAGATDNTTTVNVIDQLGKPMIEGEWKVSLSISGPATFAQGATTKTLTWNKWAANTVTVNATETGAQGEIVISATAEGLTAGSDKIIAAVPQSAAAIKVSTDATSTEITAIDSTDAGAAVTTDAAAIKGIIYNVSVTDKNGVPVDAASGTTFKVVIDGLTADNKANYAIRVFDKTVGAGWTTWSGLTEDNTATPAVNESSYKGLDLTKITKIEIASKKAGNVTFSLAQDAASPTLSASAATSLTVKSGAVAMLKAPTKKSYDVLRGEKVSLTYQIADKYGNAVTAKDLVVDFPAVTGGLKLNGNSAAFSLKTDANGQVTVEALTEQVSTLGTTFKPTTAVGSYAAADVTITGKASIIGAVDVTSVAPSTGTNVYITAGGNAKVTFSVKDTFGYALTGLTAADFELTSNVADDPYTVGGTLTFTPNGDGTYTFDGIPVTKAGVASFTVAAVKVQADVNGSRGISVRPDATSIAQIVVTNAAVKTAGTFNYTADADANKAVTFTVALADAYGNIVTGADNGSPRSFKVSFTNSAGVTSYYAIFQDQDGVGLPATTGGSLVAIAAGRNAVTFTVTTNDDKGTVTIADTAATGTLSSATIELK
ncbi:MAG TPA: hypothetical protein VK191_08390 [Symbiobacteriaceae bacterium]|nr:hypothetical protein [Symbiobacteriaceae bacterium]